jgi:hypothetical protein
MLRNLGKLIWKQSRDINVLNYPNYMVYEIYTNNGFLHFIQEKEGGKIECSKMSSINRNESVQTVWRGEDAQNVSQTKRLS